MRVLLSRRRACCMLPPCCTHGASSWLAASRTHVPGMSSHPNYSPGSELSLDFGPPQKLQSDLPVSCIQSRCQRIGRQNWECIELPHVDFPVSIHCGIWHSVLAGCGNHNLLLAGHRFLHLHGSVLVDQGIGCCRICNLHSPGKKFPILVFCSHPSSLLACST